MIELTKKQASVLAYLQDYQNANGYSPTIREICSQFGFKSTNSASGHLLALEKKGAIKTVVGQARCIKILCGQNEAEVMLKAYRRYIGNPYATRVCENFAAGWRMGRFGKVEAQ